MTLLLSKLAQLHFDLKHLSDVTLVAGNGEQTIIHPIILAVVSEFFRELILVQPKSHGQLVIFLPDFSYTEVNELLEGFIRNGTSDNSLMNMMFGNHKLTKETNKEYPHTDIKSIDKIFIETNINVDVFSYETQITYKTIENEYVNSHINVKSNDNISIETNIKDEKWSFASKIDDNAGVSEYGNPNTKVHSNEEERIKKQGKDSEDLYERQNNSNLSESEDVNFVSKTNSDEEIKCPYCAKIFKTNKRMECHLTLTHESKKEYFEYMKLQGTNNWVCQLCFKTFVNEKGCTRHLMSLHKLGKKYECNVCQKSLVGKYNYEIHKSLHKNVPTVCDLCGLELAEKRYLKKHHIKIHASEEEKNQSRIYACKTCPKTFYTKTSLTSHEYLHSESYNFICGKCSKSFKTDNGLRTHNNVTHLGKLQKQSTRDKHNALAKERRKEQKIRNGGVFRVGDDRLKFNDYMRTWTQRKKLKDSTNISN